MKFCLALLALFASAGTATAQQVTVTVPSIVSVPPAGFTKLANIFTADFTADLGAVAALIGTIKTQTITGLRTTDQVLVQTIGTPTAGATIANAWVSSSDTLSIAFTTAVALGITLGSQTYRVTVFR